MKSRVETLHSELKNVSRGLKDLQEEDTAKSTNSSKTLASTEEQVIKLETRVSEVKGLSASIGLQDDFSGDIYKIETILEEQRKSLKTRRRRLLQIMKRRLI